MFPGKFVRPDEICAERAGDQTADGSQKLPALKSRRIGRCHRVVLEKPVFTHLRTEAGGEGAGCRPAVGSSMRLGEDEGLLSASFLPTLCAASRASRTEFASNRIVDLPIAGTDPGRKQVVCME